MMPSDPVVGGTVLRRAAIQSPNFVHGVQGWAISADGSAEFHDVILPASAKGATVTFSATAPASPNTGDLWYNTGNGLEVSQWNGSAWVPYQIGSGAIAAGTIVAGIVDGTLIQGAQFVADGTSGEILAYSSSPVHGNLLLSVSPVSGTDGHANNYTAGVASYGANSFVTLYNNSGNGAIIFGFPNAAHNNVSPVIFGNIGNSGAANEVAELILSSGKESSLDDAALQLFSEAADASSAALAVVEFGGHNEITIAKGKGIRATQPGTSTTIEGWHNVTPPSPWSGTLRYKLTAENAVRIQANLSASTGVTANPEVLFVLPPTGYQPFTQAQFPAGVFATSPTIRGYVLIDGTVQLQGASASNPFNQCGFVVDIPLD